MKGEKDSENLNKLAQLIWDNVADKSTPISRLGVKVGRVQKEIPIFEGDVWSLFEGLVERGVIGEMEWGSDGFETIYFQISVPELKKYIESGQSKFDDKTGFIMFDGKECQIEMLSKQYYCCKEILSRPLGEWLSVDDIFQTINGVEAEIDKKGEKEVSDAVRLINKKAQNCFRKGNLFEQRKDMFRRLF